MARLEMKNKNQLDGYISPWKRSEAIKIRVWEVVWTLFVRWLPKPFSKWHILLLKMFGSKISGRPFIAPSCRIYAPWLLEIGNRSCLAPRSEVYNLGPIRIGERVTIAQYVYLCNGTHDFSKKSLPLLVGAMAVENDVFVGARALILPGLTLGKASVVGAGAILTKDTKPYGIYAGNPAVFIKKRELMNE